jgi:hypothetical protein
VLAADQVEIEPIAVTDLADQQKDDACGMDTKPINECICLCYEPVWKVYAGAVIMKRESPSLFTDFDFDFEGGVDASISRRLNDRYSLQCRYFGIDHWGAQVSALGGFVGADYTSKLHSTEVNLLSDWFSDRVTLLAGFRWVELHEELSVAIGLPFIPNPVIRNDTDNHMYGFQIGGDIRLWDRGGPLTISTAAKAGIYHNDADLGAQFAGGLFGFDVGEDHTAFLGELDVVGKYALTDNIAIRAAYQMMWIEGVVTAEGQLISLLSTGSLDTGGSPFYHGAAIGLELSR